MIRLSDGERDILNEIARDCQDDGPDPEEVEVVTAACPGCGKPVRRPIDADGDDECCSAECVRVVCARMDAEIAAWRAQEVAEMVARLRAVSCRECGRAFVALPEDAGLCPNRRCNEAVAGRLYADTPPYSSDQIPF